MNLLNKNGKIIEFLLSVAVVLEVWFCSRIGLFVVKRGLAKF